MSVLDWLVDSDPAIRWQVLRDLLHAPSEIVGAERARTATEGWGAKLLALQGEDGQWAGGAWTKRSICSGRSGNLMAHCFWKTRIRERFTSRLRTVMAAPAGGTHCEHCVSSNGMRSTAPERHFASQENREAPHKSPQVAFEEIADTSPPSPFLNSALGYNSLQSGRRRSLLEL
jgi:hypothetical protein